MLQNSIKLPLLLHSFLIVVMSLTLTGIAVDYVLRDLHQKSATDELNHGLSSFGEQIKLMLKEQTREGNLIKANEKVIAGLNLIHNYQDKDNYSAILFDEEKKRLADIMMAPVSGLDADGIILFDDLGDPVSYIWRTTDGLRQYLRSYHKGKPQTLTRLAPFEENWQLITSSTPHPPILHWGQEHVQAHLSHFHIEQGMLLVETHVPIMRERLNEEPVQVGQVALFQAVNSDFLQSLSTSVPLQYALFTDDGTILLDRYKLLADKTLISQYFERASNDEHALTKSAGNYLQFAHGPVADGQQIHIVAAYPASFLDQAVQRTRLVVVLLVVAGSLVIIPVSLWFSNRLVSMPLEQLSTGVNQYKQGNYEHQVKLDAPNEFGELAKAMNQMARTVNHREAELSAIIGNIPQMVFVKDAETLRFLHFNQAGEKLLGYKKSELLGKSDYDFFPREQADFFISKDRAVLESKQILDIPEEPIETKEGKRILHTRKVPILDKHGKPQFLLGVSDDITEQKKTEEQTRLWAAIFRNSTEAVIITDANANIVAVNQAYSAITGYSEEEILGKNPRILKSGHYDQRFYQNMWHDISTHDSWCGELWNRNKEGDLFAVWETISAIRNDRNELTHYVGLFSDITHVKKAQEKLDFLAHHDPLTMMPNRMLFNDRLNHAISRARRDQTQLGVIFMDLDRFKNINDSLGHPIGDDLLKIVAKRLNAVLREEDTLARVGGDEFMVLLEHLMHPTDAAISAQKLLDAFNESFMVHDHELIISASIGISLFPDDADDDTALVRNADAAMYKSKELGRNQYSFYTEDMTSMATERVALEQSLRRALVHGELSLVYQPQVMLENGRLTGVEALIRWNSPVHGNVPPDVFIPLAEETHMILDIGEWVIFTACAQYREWTDQGLHIPRFSVNVSSVQVAHCELDEIVNKALTAYDIPKNVLELELTEAVFMTRTEHVYSMMDKLDGLHVELALDDFGTGFSSLSYLKRFFFDRLKIDRSFTMDVLNDPNNLAISRSIIALGNSLGMQVIAEGVETEEQAVFLAQEGCAEGQGYYYSRPLSADDFAAYVRETTAEK